MYYPDWNKKYRMSIPVYLVTNSIGLAILILVQIGLIVSLIYILSIKFHFIVIFIAIGLSAIFIINIYWIIKGYKYISSYLKNYEMFKDYYFKIIDPKKFQKEKFIDEVKKRHPSFNVDPDVNEFKEEKTILKMRNEMWSLYLLDTRELGTRRIYCHIGPIINDEDRDILTDFDSILSKYVIMIYE